MGTVVFAAAQGLDIHTMRAMLLTSLVLACLLAGASGKRRVGHGRGKGKGKDRKLMGPKSWHVAGPEGKASCGNYTLLYTEELPSSLCETALHLYPHYIYIRNASKEQEVSMSPVEVLQIHRDNMSILFIQQWPDELANSPICQCVTRGGLSGQEEVEW